MVERKIKLLHQPNLHGFEYGMLYDFEASIAGLQNAQLLVAPKSPWPIPIACRLLPVTKYRMLHGISPKWANPVEADEIWSILMGPEAYPLWHYRSWANKVGKSVLYLFDTLRHQLSTIKKLLIATKWDDLITSFPMSVPLLENATGRKWRSIPQAVDLNRFYPLQEDTEPTIAFSSYGRRLPKVHDALLRLCSRRKLHYDYSISSSLSPSVSSTENYDIYAWHLRQSWFNVCWPVETTNPERAAGFSPLTCRWFEAAASGATVIGDSPLDPTMKRCFGDNFVEEIDYQSTSANIEDQLEDLWVRRRSLKTIRRSLHRDNSQMWSWKNRVLDILHRRCWFRQELL